MSKGRCIDFDDESWRKLQERAVAERMTAQLKPLTPNQGVYLEALEKSTVTFCTGPAGTGKTWLACGKAVQWLRAGKIQRIVLTRPLVSCGAGMGFLPGDKDEKVAPFMRPLLDAFGDFMSASELERYFHDGQIEMMALDLMRGASLKQTVLILDEAQNAQENQLHMLLTRFGQGSKVIVTGCLSSSQNDLNTRQSALAVILGRFHARGEHPQVQHVRLTRADIVRHPLIQYIDETITGDYEVQDEVDWLDLRCPGCKAPLWYSEDRAGAQVERVACYACGATVELFEEDDSFAPHCVSRRADAVSTLPVRP